MEHQNSYDVVVVGSGGGGFAAALTAACAPVLIAKRRLTPGMIGGVIGAAGVGTADGGGDTTVIEMPLGERGVARTSSSSSVWSDPSLGT